MNSTNKLSTNERAQALQQALRSLPESVLWFLWELLQARGNRSSGGAELDADSATEHKGVTFDPRSPKETVVFDPVRRKA